ncbi:MAG: HDOD domain-containing protein [Gammaproteobacteria bacterium]|nr:HDOD domain-containing protein [Gammaproteobacteria bacterium]
MEYVENFFIGRQPIFDRQQKVIGYELLYRTEETPDRASFDNGDKATSQVIINSIMDIGLERLVGQRIAFINLTKCFISGEISLPFEPNQIVLELLEDIEPTEAVIEGLTALKNRGYPIALDDFSYSEQHRPLLDLADIVKLDVMGLEPGELELQVEQLKGRNVKLLAEKVETQEEFQHCFSLGFDYFQGYFLSKPELVTGNRIPTNRMTIINLIIKLQSSDTEIADLEEVIQQDVSLSYRLLRLINSAAFNLGRTVKSIKHAITIVGVKVIRDWARLLLLSQIDNKNPELIWRALFRGKMCESIGTQIDTERADQFFTVGLFSVIDTLLDRPLPELLEKLPLESEIVNALLGEGDGRLAQALNLVDAYDRADWEKVEHSELNSDQIREIYIEAVHDTDQKMRFFNI